jgi:exodeoxyribonuclease-3
MDYALSKIPIEDIFDWTCCAVEGMVCLHLRKPLRIPGQRRVLAPGGVVMQQMRIVSWNACDGFVRKFGHLERLRPDIAVLQEVRPECLTYAALSENAVWIGDAGQKGLAAVGYGGWKVSRAAMVPAERWFLPLCATKNDQRINVVAVWVDSAKECAPPTLRALSQLEQFVKSGPTVIAGDFNQSITLDRRRGPGRRFADVLQVLGDWGFSSAWHSHHKQDHGEEDSPTLYWTWNSEKKFHIDFVFGSADISVQQATLGSFDQYVQGKISDHVPLVVDYSFKS